MVIGLSWKKGPGGIPSLLLPLIQNHFTVRKIDSRSRETSLRSLRVRSLGPSHLPSMKPACPVEGYPQGSVLLVMGLELALYWD